MFILGARSVQEGMQIAASGSVRIARGWDTRTCMIDKCSHTASLPPLPRKLIMMSTAIWKTSSQRNIVVGQKNMHEMYHRCFEFFIQDTIPANSYSKINGLYMNRGTTRVQAESFHRILEVQYAQGAVSSYLSKCRACPTAVIHLACPAFVIPFRARKSSC